MVGLTRDINRFSHVPVEPFWDASHAYHCFISSHDSVGRRLYINRQTIRPNSQSIRSHRQVRSLASLDCRSYEYSVCLELSYIHNYMTTCYLVQNSCLMI